MVASRPPIDAALLRVGDRLLQPGAKGALERLLVPVHVAAELGVEREHELLAGRAQLARGAVEPVEGDALERGLESVAREGLALGARVGCDRLAVVERAPAELDRDEDHGGDAERGEREVALPRTAHAGALRTNATEAAPASSAKIAERTNDERNARVSTA